MTGRTGRRSAGGDTRTAILAAARRAFAAAGYEATSMRAVAREAGVDAALVTYYFQSKPSLFAAAMRLPVNLPAAVEALVAQGADGLGERLVRLFLGIWEDERGREPLLALVRSAVSHEAAAATLRAFLTEAFIGRIAARLGVADAPLRATLVGSQLVGLAMVRYVVAAEPLASAGVETVVAWLAPSCDRYLTGAAQEGHQAAGGHRLPSVGANPAGDVE